MKKALFVFTIIIASFSINAQEISKNTIGLRFANNINNGFSQLTYQRKINNNNRLELQLDLATRSITDLKVTGLYEWVFSLKDKFNWYTGAGLGINNTFNTNLFAVGILGVEYNFDAPFLISADIRPELGLSNGSRLSSFGNFGISVRYQF